MRQTRPYQILKAKYQTASSGLIAMGSATLGPGTLAIHKYSSDHGSNAPSGSPSRETENEWASICTYRCSRKHGLPTLYAKIDKAERGKRAAEALAMVGLADRA